jgi:glycosyltransferase involved in cell wall biosynthesis
MIDHDAASASARVILLVPGFPEDERDSTCLPALQSFVEALSRSGSGPATDVIAFQYPYQRRSYTWRGVRVHAMGGGNSGFKKPFTWLRALKRGRRIAAERPAHTTGVIHSFWLGECALIGSVLARLLGWRHVVSIGGQEIRRPTAYSRLLDSSRFVLTAGSEYAANVAQYGVGCQVDFIIPLGLNSQRVHAVASPAERDIDILAVGSMTPVKRFSDVISVVADIAESHPKVRVALIGDGPCRGNIESLVKQKGLAAQVRLMGELPRDEVLRLMLRSKVLLHPSEYESQGYVFLEALASGSYVVCRDVGFTGQSRKVVRCEDVIAMARAVSRILDSETDYEPVNVPSADETAEAFLEIYRSPSYFNDFGGTSHLRTP